MSRNTADRNWKKYLRRGILLFQFLLILFSSSAQDSILHRRVSLSLKQIPLGKALEEIGRHSQTNFTYNSELFNHKRPITLKAENQRLDSLLRSILPDTTLLFHVVNQQIIISPKRKKISEKKISPSDKGFLDPDLHIQGKIVDEDNGKPLAFASIGILGQPMGTISNEDGKFMLTLPAHFKKDTLVFSYVGFRNKTQSISKLTTAPVNIKLKKEFISLQEVIIRSSEPNSIIRSALKKIRQNYIQQPAELTTFYRESVKKNNRFMIYVEAVMNIYKSSYKANQMIDMAKVYKSRKIYDVDRLDTVSLRLKGGVGDCLKLDIIKNPPTFLQEDFLPYYKFELEDISTFDNHPVYILSFRPNIEIKEPHFLGKIYVDIQSLAIIRAEFGYPSHKIKKLRNQLIVRKSNKVRVTPTKIKYSISFRNVNGKYYLSHVKGNLAFKVRHRRKLFSSNFEVGLEMATTQLDTNKVKRYRYREILKPNTVFSKEKFAYDAEFWGGDIFIQPEENIQDAMKRINSSMQQFARNKEEEK
ncbi:MAG: carboxypeptidase-like regulatory domain-containing protein [Marinifilaceae bacterium]